MTHLTKLRHLVSIVALAFCAACAGQGQMGRLERPASSWTIADEATLAVNEERARHGLRPVRPHARLADAAAGHALDQAQRNTMSHFGARGGRLEHRLRAAGYAFAQAGENVSKGRQTGEEVVSAWMSSSPHRSTLLHPDLSEIGVAVAYAENGQPYWALVMAEPRRYANVSGS